MRVVGRWVRVVTIFGFGQRCYSAVGLVLMFLRDFVWSDTVGVETEVRSFGVVGVAVAHVFRSLIELIGALVFSNLKIMHGKCPSYQRRFAGSWVWGL